MTRSLNVKNEPKASAETLYTLEKGYKVNYDKVLTADNHQWISYISYSGTRRYVDIATLKTTESKPVAPKDGVKPAPKPELTPEKTTDNSEVTEVLEIPDKGTYHFRKLLM